MFLNSMIIQISCIKRDWKAGVFQWVKELINQRKDKEKKSMDSEREWKQLMVEKCLKEEELEEEKA